MPRCARTAALRLSTALAVISVVFGTNALSLHAATRLRIQTAAPDALGVIAQFPLPTGAPTSGSLDLGQGRSVPYQAGPDRKAAFILPESARHDPIDAQLRTTPATIPPTVTTGTAGNAIPVQVRNREVVRYQGAPAELPRADIQELFRRGGYLHPILSPGGRLVSDDYPPNHIHHHGIWSPWTKTSFEGRHPDFWNMGEGKGRVEFESVEAHVSGPVFASVRARHRFIDMLAQPEKPALNETWEVRVYAIESAAARPCWIFDLTIAQTCASASPLELPKYHYGGLGFRGNRAWDGAGNCRFLTSEGVTNRVAGNETRGRWCWIGGSVDGALCGAAVLCHPDNFRAPQPMRLHPTEPFFCYAPSQLGDWSITPEKPYVARYRFVVFDGPPDPKWIDRLWDGYAKPPAVEVR